MIKTIPNTPEISHIRYCPPFSAVCSIGKAPFHGRVEIVFQSADLLLEYESFEAWLRSIANSSLTIEDFARLVFDQLTLALGEIPLTVSVRAETTVHAPVCATIER